MSVVHDWECAAHGHFEARGTESKKPKCPKGCSTALVKMVFLQPVGHVSARTRRGDRLVREMAERQGLSDISTSPSRPGGSVAERNRMKNQQAMRARGPQGFQYPAAAAAQAAETGKFLGAMTMHDNALSRVGLGHPYEKAEWRTDKDGKAKHVGAQPALEVAPSASVERVREAPK